MPKNQLAKCAEAQGLRKAFPKALAKVYTPEEMAQADVIDESPVPQAQPKKLAPPPISQDESAWLHDAIAGRIRAASNAEELAVAVAEATKAKSRLSVDDQKSLGKIFRESEKRLIKQAESAESESEGAA